MRFKGFITFGNRKTTHPSIWYVFLSVHTKIDKEAQQKRGVDDGTPESAYLSENMFEELKVEQEIYTDQSRSSYVLVINELQDMNDQFGWKAIHSV